MIRAEFCESSGRSVGFRINGHSGYAESGQDVVCAAVSSAVQLTINILEGLEFAPTVTVEDNDISCIVKKYDVKAAHIILLLMQHFESILDEFPNTIKITTKTTTTEV